MQHLFVEYPIALELKNKGFNEPCFAAYIEMAEKRFDFMLNSEWQAIDDSIGLGNNLITNAPLHQQVIDFLLKFGYFIQTGICGDDTIFMVIYHKNNGIIYNEKGFKDNYEALNKAIEEALKLI